MCHKTWRDEKVDPKLGNFKINLSKLLAFANIVQGEVQAKF